MHGRVLRGIPSAAAIILNTVASSQVEGNSKRPCWPVGSVPLLLSSPSILL